MVSYLRINVEVKLITPKLGWIVNGAGLTGSMFSFLLRQV